MNPPNTLYRLSGKISVTARGYWYTSGGEKGPFGFYPHLKEREEKSFYPLFPDTQVHGNLKTAALWLTNRDLSFTQVMINSIFGTSGQERASAFYLTDLRLNSDSKKKWQQRYFDVNPRTAISDKTRTNENHMLVNLEFSYLQGLTLEADFYLGWATKKEALESTVELIKKSFPLFPGFGAFRSRGNGRGIIEISDVQIPEKKFVAEKDLFHIGEYLLSLENLVHFRNKPINPSSVQLLQSEKVIKAEKLRSWFLRTYFQIFEEWPTPDQMSGLKFFPLYPSSKDEKGVLPAYPPPKSTLRFEDGSIRDCFQDSSEEKKADQENLFQTKAKPLSEGLFLTNKAKPDLIEVRTEKRMRNSIDEKTFTTKKDDGLFAQELIHQGTCFAGALKINIPDETFGQRAMFILKEINPEINGSLFQQSIKPLLGNTPAKASPFLVTSPAPFSIQHRKTSAIQVQIGVDRSYNAKWKRPRRNRIVFTPGSLLQEPMEGYTMSWYGIKAQIKEPDVPKEPTESPASLPKPELPKGMEKVSRAQMGNLRQLLYLKPDMASRHLKDLLEKYKKWKKESLEEPLIPADVLKSLKEKLENKDVQGFREYILKLTNDYALHIWQDKRKEAKKEFINRKGKAHESA